MYIDASNDTATDLSTFLNTIDDSSSTIKGHFRVSQKFSPGVFKLYTITSITDNTGWFTVNCSYVSGNGTLSNSDDVLITFARTGDKGDTGLQGTQGTTGAQGAVGTQGVQGLEGFVGSNGAQGTVGSQGTQGTDGAQGTQGTLGTQGATGAQGVQGTQGVQGVQGTLGIQGVQGTLGTQGTIGSESANPTVTVLLYGGM